MTIRRATIEDVKTLQELNKEVFIDNYKYDKDLVMDWALGEPGKKYFEGVLTDPQCAVFIAEESEREIGYISASRKKSSYRKSSYCEIDNMGVIPEYRSQGVGAKLMTKLKAWAKESGYEKLYVSSYFHNNRAVAFYIRNGFAEFDLALVLTL